MRKKIGVIGNGVKLAHDFALVTNDVRGADVVVLAGEADLEYVRHNAPASTVLVLGDAERCKQIYEGMLFPRGRIIGVGPDQVEGVADSILSERGDEHDVLAMADGQFGPRRARLGHRGITELL